MGSKQRPGLVTWLDFASLAHHGWHAWACLTWPRNSTRNKIGSTGYGGLVLNPNDFEPIWIKHQKAHSTTPNKQFQRYYENVIFLTRVHFGEFLVLHPESKKVPCIFLDQQFSRHLRNLIGKKKKSPARLQDKTLIGLLQTDQVISSRKLLHTMLAHNKSLRKYCPCCHTLKIPS